MDTANFILLKEYKEKFPEHFKDCNVLEIGILNFPNFRAFFDDSNYIGIDMTPGPGVDIVCRGQDTDFPEDHFTTMICYSVFEHDPQWKEILTHNMPFLKDGALIFLCFGAERNEEHGPYPWALIPEQEFLDYAKTLPVEVLESYFQTDKYKDVPDPCVGAYDAVLRVKKV